MAQRNVTVMTIEMTLIRDQNEVYVYIFMYIYVYIYF